MNQAYSTFRDHPRLNKAGLVRVLGAWISAGLCAVEMGDNPG